MRNLLIICVCLITNYSLTAQTWISYPGENGYMYFAGETASGGIIGAGLLPNETGDNAGYQSLHFNPVTAQVDLRNPNDSIEPVPYLAHTIDHQGNLCTIHPDGFDHLFTKIDSSGNIILQTDLEFLITPPENTAQRITPLSNGDFLCLFNWATTTVARLDSLGNLLWYNEILFHFDGKNFITENEDSTLSMISAFHADFEDWTIETRRLDFDGNIIDSVQQYIIEDNSLDYLHISPASEGGTLVLTIDGIFEVSEEIKLYKVNNQAQLEWEYVFPLGEGYYASQILEVSPNRIAIWGQNFNIDPAPTFVSILDTLGNIINYTEYAIADYIVFNSLELISDSRMLAAGYGYDLDGSPIISFVLLTDSLGQAAVTNIHGSLFLDTDDNCNLDSVDFTMANWLVGLVDNDTIYRATNSNGEYTFVVNEGTYELTAQFPAALYDHCSPMTIVDVPADVDSVFVDYAVTPLIFCPYLNIEVAAPLLRRCFTNTYHVLYQNQGTDVALDAYTEIELDQYLELISASIPFTPLGNNKYSFDLGDIPPGVENLFTFDAYLSCGDSTILGMAHCVEAHIYPDTLCLLPDPLWSEASLALDGLCDLDTDSVRFTITNDGDGPMNQNLEYIVIEDDIIMNSTNDPTQLDIGEQYEVAFPSNGATWRLNVDQVDFHPGFSSPTLAIEGCGTDGNGDFTIGFVTMFPEDEQDHFVSIDCQENVGSYDPNYKEAGFKGYAENHYIEANQPLEYTIHFQNTGTDTAFTVILHDQLSPFLDHRSIQAGISSHNYTMDLDSTGLLKFTFNDILLPDSTTNEPASHGFVKFKIDQIPDNPVNTVITNTADIFFDFNDPITTNTVFHTIGEDFIEMQSFSSIYEALEAEIAVFPNPWAEEATLVLKGMNLEDAVLEIYSTDGRYTHQQKIRENITRIYRNALNPGLYYFRIIQGRRTIGTGQFIIAGE